MVVAEEEAKELEAAVEGGEVGAAEGVGELGLDKGVEAVEDGLGRDAEDEKGAISSLSPCVYLTDRRGQYTFKCNSI